jgi:hypothetical protein
VEYETARTSSESATARQIKGLTDPFGTENSISTHVGAVRSGIGSMFHRPVGQGLGVITHASGRLGGELGGTESDPSNVAVAAGFAGFVGYLLVVYLGLSRAWRLARTRRAAWAAVLAMLIGCGLSWLISGNYIIVVIAWYLLGCVDHATMLREDSAASRRAEVAVE